jgi:hypothetical protein
MTSHLQTLCVESKLQPLLRPLAAALVVVAHALPLSAVAQTPSQALPVIGGTTSIKLTSSAAFQAGGVSVGVFGSTLFSPGSDGVPLIYLPITGGSIDTASLANFGQIEHQGTGLSFGFGGNTVSFSNFVIDTAALRISAVVSSPDQHFGVLPVLALSQSGNTAAPVALAFTAEAAGAFTAALGSPNATGLRLGLANTVPITAAVPEPATVVSMLAGLG